MTGLCPQCGTPVIRPGAACPSCRQAPPKKQRGILRGRGRVRAAKATSPMLWLGVIALGVVVAVVILLSFAQVGKESREDIQRREQQQRRHNETERQER